MKYLTKLERTNLYHDVLLNIQILFSDAKSGYKFTNYEIKELFNKIWLLEKKELFKIDMLKKIVDEEINRHLNKKGNFKSKVKSNKYL